MCVCMCDSQEMGIPLRIFARLQFNLAINHVDDIEAVATFPDIVFPIMWFEDVSTNNYFSLNLKK